MFLGYVYTDRLAGDRNRNYQSAIAAFEAALSVKSAYVDKVAVQYQRGDLYRLIEPLGSAQNIEIAIAAYKEVLQYKPMGGKSEWRRWANAWAIATSSGWKALQRRMPRWLQKPMIKR